MYLTDIPLTVLFTVNSVFDQMFGVTLNVSETTSNSKIISSLFEKTKMWHWIDPILLHLKWYHATTTTMTASWLQISSFCSVPMHMAVPVSWHPGNTMLAAMLAFFSSSSATNRSLLEASGSFKMFDSCCQVHNYMGLR